MIEFGEAYFEPGEEIIGRRDLMFCSSPFGADYNIGPIQSVVVIDQSAENPILCRYMVQALVPNESDDTKIEILCSHFRLGDQVRLMKCSLWELVGEEIIAERMEAAECLIDDAGYVRPNFSN